MARSPHSEPQEPTVLQLRIAWRSLVLRDEEGGGCLGERERLAAAIRRVEFELLEGSMAAPEVDR